MRLANAKPLMLMALLLCAAALMQATTVWSPSSVVSNTGGNFATCCDITVATTNQNGLLTHFTSGSTDWDTYFAGNPLHTYFPFVSGPCAASASSTTDCEWFASSGVTTSTIILDFGFSIPLNKLALWNEDADGIASMVVSASDDVTFGSGVSSLGTFNPALSTYQANYGAQIFSFSLTTARYVRLVVTAPGSPNDANSPTTVSMGQIAFSSTIPEPGSWMLMGLGLAAVGLGRWRWQRRMVKLRSIPQ